MKVTPLLDHFDLNKTIHLLKDVPVFDWVLSSHPEEFNKLLHHCRLFRLQPGEMIIKKGEINHWIYVVLKGGCFAFMDESDQTPINQLHPYDIFGELAAILEEPRSASIVTNYDEEESLLLGIDFVVFSSTETELDISVKKLQYQAIQRTIFKRLRSVYNDLAEHQQVFEELPKMLQPPRYISEKEQLMQYVQNCKEGAKVLQRLSEQLANILN